MQDTCIAYLGTVRNPSIYPDLPLNGPLPSTCPGPHGPHHEEFPGLAYCDSNNTEPVSNKGDQGFMLAKSFEKEFARSCKMIHATKNVASAKTLAFCSNANRGNIAKITSNDTDARLSDVPDNVGYDDKLTTTSVLLDQGSISSVSDKGPDVVLNAIRSADKVIMQTFAGAEKGLNCSLSVSPLKREKRFSQLNHLDISDTLRFNEFVQTEKTLTSIAHPTGNHNAASPDSIPVEEHLTSVADLTGNHASASPDSIPVEENLTLVAHLTGKLTTASPDSIPIEGGSSDFGCPSHRQPRFCVP